MAYAKLVMLVPRDQLDAYELTQRGYDESAERRNGDVVEFGHVVDVSGPTDPHPDR